MVRMVRMLEVEAAMVVVRTLFIRFSLLSPYVTDEKGGVRQRARNAR